MTTLSLTIPALQDEIEHAPLTEAELWGLNELIGALARFAGHPRSTQVLLAEVAASGRQARAEDNPVALLCYQQPTAAAVAELSTAAAFALAASEYCQADQWVRAGQLDRARACVLTSLSAVDAGLRHLPHPEEVGDVLVHAYELGKLRARAPQRPAQDLLQVLAQDAAGGSP